jgi:aminoglycoside phosphotransferase (APT) family kinase protein
VHYDYHLGNILVDPHDPSRVTAILDWDGARPGSVAIELAVLAFDLTHRSPGERQKRVEAQLLAGTNPGKFPRSGLTRRCD